MEIDPVANIFPPMAEEDFAAFKQDMAEHGLKEPIITYSGKIIDGRTRKRACDELGIKPRYIEWDGTGGTLTEYVVSLNLHRRHLTTNQKAMLAVKIADSHRDEAHARSQSNLPNLETAILGENPDCHKSDTRGIRTTEVAARAVGTSRFPVEAAIQVSKTGTPELIAAVQAEQVAVHNAAEIARLPPDEQNEIVAAGEERMKDAGKELRQKRQEAKKPAEATQPLINKGIAAVKSFLDEEVESAARDTSIHAQPLFEQATRIRAKLVGV